MRTVRPGAAVADRMAAELAPGRLHGGVDLSSRNPEALGDQLEVVDQGLHRLAHDVRDVIGRVAEPVRAHGKLGWPADLGVLDHDRDRAAAVARRAGQRTARPTGYRISERCRPKSHILLPHKARPGLSLQRFYLMYARHILDSIYFSFSVVAVVFAVDF